MITRSFITLLFSALLGLAITGCYPIPSEDDCSIVPLTNNPDITGGAY